MPRYFICQFLQDSQGRWNYRPPFRALPVSLDRTNTIEPMPGRKYLVEVVKELPGQRCFARVIEDTREIFFGLQQLLAEATWQRPDHVTGDPWIEVEHPKYGSIKAKFYRPTGGLMRRGFVEITFTTSDGALQSFTLEDDAHGLLGRLAKRVNECVGPAVNLAAAISRQADSRRNNSWR